MTLKLTPEILRAAYDYFLTTQPFCRRSWAMPPSGALRFRVLRGRLYIGSYCHEDRLFAASNGRIGHTYTLMITMAHEMVHVCQAWNGHETRGVEHNADFVHRGHQVCKNHGFDPLEFVGAIKKPGPTKKRRSGTKAR